jgi:hypothetical protein
VKHHQSFSRVQEAMDDKLRPGRPLEWRQVLWEIDALVGFYSFNGLIHFSPVEFLF